MIRIIAGEFRHREITNPSRDKTRPTQDRVREAIFSALGPSVINRTVLDLFAGSGAYSFEALSRGAIEATMVDSSKVCIEAMTKTTNSLHIEDKVHLVNKDAFAFLADTKTKFDLVFLDPPYKSYLNESAISTLLSLSLLSDNAIIVAEQDKDLEPLEGFTLKTYTYGSKKVGIYRRII